MENESYDFSGWATRNDIKCSDGRTIRANAFAEDSGKTVPLVWNHSHDEVSNVLGHALLENREGGVYAYCSLNETPAGQTAKSLVQHGDVKALSIYANKLQQQGGDVLHGSIKEVSLVLAGANSGAYIDSVMMHGEMGSDEDEAIICSGIAEDSLELFHAESKEEKKDTEENKEDKEVPEEKKESSEKTVKDVFDSMTDEQKNVVYFMIGEALEGKGKDKSDSDDNNKEEDKEVKHNVFESDNEVQTMALSDDQKQAILKDAKRYGSLKESFLQHGENDGFLKHDDGDYGITDIDYLFPDAKNLDTPPQFIQREMDWVQVVMQGVHHTPFSRIKSMFADITADEARAKGYTKGNKKVEEVISLLKRSTTPTTIYKKQKLDRDDTVDITDFDVVAWLRAEMRVMLDEEIARAILIGDGRLASDDDKIDETHIRPVWTDDDLFTIKYEISTDDVATDDTDAFTADELEARAFIEGCIKSRKDYKGSGNPIMFTTEDMVTKCLLLKDKNRRYIYESESQLATACRVSKIVTVEVMEDATRTNSDGDTVNLLALYLNLSDYNCGADKGGSVNMFDDFDIDYNQMKYLIETRCSGALIKPYAAVAIEMAATSEETEEA